jgi:ribonuclease PH
MTQRIPPERANHAIRSLSMEPGFTRYAEGSVLIRMGETHVLCTASVEESVPGWLKGKGKGWITAEYSMLPRATHTRSKRDREKVSGRTQEIQRLIGRALRSMIRMEHLGERSILVDCDVLQADGGTRTASITGGCVALGIALGKLIASGKVPPAVWSDTVAAVSIGMKDGIAMVDLDYIEDSSIDVDMNFVITGQGGFVEIQGTGEKKTFSETEMSQMTQAALKASSEIKNIQLEIFKNLNIPVPK